MQAARATGSLTQINLHSRYNYQQTVKNACYSLDLDTDEYDLVDQINNYVISNYDYVLFDSAYMPHFIDTHTGQCYHYAKMFADMCQSVGINAWKVEGNNHAWDNVEVDGKVYVFDPTFADTNNNVAGYSWQ